MIHDLLKQMTLKEKVGQINQHLYGWEVYTKDENGIHLTQKFKDEVKKFDGIGAIYGLYRSDPW
ncbi:MAG TPA: hypothetical protein VFC75_01115, partial [Erysipelothrix sp.]|nr:hypothetical protein [Erysipelothrix sp.]